MVSLQDLTVGEVSGMIAAAVFIVQFFVPIALPIVLLGLLRPRSSASTEKAVSWSIIGRFLHNSLWPTLLGTDSAATLKGCKPALFVSYFRVFMLLLIAVAAIVTPLGLYEGIVASSRPESPVFHYIVDKSAMGYGTPPRSNNTWSRLCGSFLLYPCPNDLNVATITENKTTISVDYKDDWYQSKVPQKVIDVFQSGVANDSTISSVFDIQYRSYVKDTINDVAKGPNVDNKTARTVGTYQPLANLILNDDVFAIEGLIVDMKNGGVGFRNHSAPAHSDYGSTWAEDLLFIEPETVCVDTNLTVEFQIPRTVSESNKAKSNLYLPALVDQGGFYKLNKTYPSWMPGDTQENPNLWYRAYRGAWLTNAYTMAYLNVTSMTNETLKTKAFAYLNSEKGKVFPLYYPNNKTATSGLTMSANSLSISTIFGTYISGLEGLSNVSTIGNKTTQYNFEGTGPLYPNPFNVNSSTFASIDTLCRGSGGGDIANITNIASKCGYLFGAPRRKDGSASLLFDPGSSWSVPMYSCMSTAKASIKTVSFRFNGTTDDLSSLKVLSVKPKEYRGNHTKPLWAVENSDMKMSSGGALWGLVSDDQAKALNLSTVRKESLYLPGRDPSITYQNMPGMDFAAYALGATYKTSSTSSLGTVDYTGKTNLAMYRKWQDLSQRPDTAAKIFNLIWTDLAANMVLGTKGLHTNGNANQKRDLVSSTPETRPVTNYTRRVKYKYVYGIPAFVALALTVATLISTFFFAVFSGARLSTMRIFLQHTSTGRFLTSQAAQPRSSSRPSTTYSGHSAEDYDGYSNAPTDVWAKGAGQQRFTLGAEGWSTSVAGVPPGYEDKGGSVTGYARVPNPMSAEGRNYLHI